MEPADKAFLGRVGRLQGDLEAVQGRLWAQNDVLLRLQSDAASLKDQFIDLQDRAAAALEALKAAVPEPAPEPEPAARQAPPVPAALPAPRLETRFYDDAPPPRRSTRIWLPYATLALAAAAMTLGLPRLYARRAAPALPPPPPDALRAVLPIDFSAREVPPPAPIDEPLAVPVSSGEGQVSQQEADSVLKLVYDYVPPGSRRSVRELLQGQISAAAQSEDGAPWIIERSDAGRFLVTLRPGGDAASAPVYEFEVDPARRAVSPSQETEADLQGGPRLADRG